MLNLELAKKFVWLLRTDIRESLLKFEDPEAEFEKWWLSAGRADYPFWGALSFKEKEQLLEPVGVVKVGKLEQSIPKAMQMVLSRRADVVQKYTQNNALNIQAVSGWFWIIGVKEHAMLTIVDLQTIKDLDRPVMVNPAEDPTPKMDVPSPTILMSLAWHLLDHNIQEGMNLQISEQRYRYFCWFFVWLTNIFKFQDLISNRWKSWLQQEVPISEGHPELGDLPRFALMEYALTQVKDRPNLSTKDGIEKTRQWAQDSLKKGKKWSWLKKKIRYVDDKFPDESTLELPPSFLTPDKSSLAHLDNPNHTRPFGVNLFGFAFGELGVGEDVRMAAMACDAASIPYRIVNISPGKEIRQADLELKMKVDQSASNAPYPINIFCLPGFDTASRVFLQMGSQIFENHYNIGWWPWELDVWPEEWNPAFDLIDEVWAGSQFSYEMYVSALAEYQIKTDLNKACMPMPLVATVDRLANAKVRYDKAHFQLPQDKFLFLYVFDFSSHLERKNPKGLIKAFEKAFPSSGRGNKSVGLVLKIMNVDPKKKEWLEFEELCQKDPRIIVINKTMDRHDVLGLIKSCDAYVSPHRAEGFGRTIAEAMLLGKPVIATNYSGNAFFMNPAVNFPVDYELVALKPGQYHFVNPGLQAHWAEPSIPHMASQMKAAMLKAKDPEFVNQTVNFATQMFAPLRTGLLMRERLEQVFPNLANEARQILNYPG
jgi:glycosyltransferase involved in cell wall biosynthesis